MAGSVEAVASLWAVPVDLTGRAVDSDGKIIKATTSKNGQIVQLIEEENNRLERVVRA